jgi:hypothetical protein
MAAPLTHYAGLVVANVVPNLALLKNKGLPSPSLASLQVFATVVEKDFRFDLPDEAGGAALIPKNAFGWPLRVLQGWGCFC